MGVGGKGVNKKWGLEERGDWQMGVEGKGVGGKEVTLVTSFEVIKVPPFRPQKEYWKVWEGNNFGKL